MRGCGLAEAASPMTERLRGRRRFSRLAGPTRRPHLLRMAAAVTLLASVLTSVAAALTPGPALGATYQDWPMFLQNPQRTAATVDPKLSVASASTLKLKFA